MKNDGGPAFPVSERRDEDGCLVRFDEPGMSLRDWFAGMALWGGIGNWIGSNASLASLGTRCYEAADAMLAEREKQ